MTLPYFPPVHPAANSKPENTAATPDFYVRPDQTATPIISEQQTHTALQTDWWPYVGGVNSPPMESFYPSPSSSIWDDINFENYQKQVKESSESFVKKLMEEGKAKKSDQKFDKNGVFPTLDQTIEMKVKLELARQRAKGLEMHDTVENKIDRLKRDKDVKIVGDSVRYEALSSFVGKLIYYNVLDWSDHTTQISKCEKWLETDYQICNTLITDLILLEAEIERDRGHVGSLFKEVYEKQRISLTSQLHRMVSNGNAWSSDIFRSALEKTMNTEVVKTDRSVSDYSLIKIPFQISVSAGSTVISENENTIAFYDHHSIEARVNSLSSLVDEEIMTERQINKLRTPQITEEVIAAWKAKAKYPEPVFISHDDIIKANRSVQEQINTGQNIENEVERINKLLKNKTIQVKDLSKFVEIGMLSKKGVEAWRITDQQKNNFFYGEEDVEEPDDTAEVKDQASVEPKGNEFLGKLSSEAGKAAVRIVSTQALNATKAMMIKAIPEDKAPMMVDFLKSELGTSLVSMMAGMGITYAVPDNENAQIIAKELRVSSIATLGNEAADMIIGGMLPVINGTISGLPSVEKDEVIIDELPLLMEPSEDMQQTISV